MIDIYSGENNLQLHYYLENGSHSMDAIILNRAENELLKIFKEIATVLDVDIIIETEALEEGGVKAIYKFVTKKKYRKNIALISAFIAGIASTVISNVATEKFNTDEEMETLQKQELRLKIQKLKNEIKEQEKLESSESDEAIKIIETNEIIEHLTSSETIKEISNFISERNKVKIYKSNFYKNIKNERKVLKVSTQIVDDKQNPITKEQVIVRKDFQDLIIDNYQIEDDYKQQVTLEIVSPVLQGNSIKWKAILNGKIITFNMRDKNFRDLILTRNLKFSNGTKIICDLETKRKMNKDGDIILGAKSVYEVIAILYSDGTKVDIL
ncbi:hypothetical protein NHN08_01545 [Riemerella anatipestifer]|uniref:hypothetical protein n=1 Tax=Riemerella anatipestifer TaxID=34085 RepID=UPI0020976B65|nr:hypothetical protein [Riemerella anatipestifer]MCO7331183.1 hypothetical protein [Riemerella anatipestifer]MCO7350346.1 hypothetical protein [Riemerella anatipestifer]